MIALKMEDMKGFTSGLFVGNLFDSWLLREAVIVTFNTFTIDGHIRAGYYTQQELEENQVGELSTWQTVRPFCFSLIKGKRLPGSFQITLQLPAAGISRFVQESQVDFRPEQVGGLYLNIRYEEGVLHCVTGLSLKVFTLDRQMEQEWDQWVKGYLKGKGIPFSDV